MSVITQSIIGKFKGRMGTISTFNSAAGNVARVAVNATNRGKSASRSAKQQNTRTRWSNMVNFYKASADWMTRAFENTKGKQSDFNKFVSLNFPNSTIYFTKEEAATGACVVERYQISQGSLRQIQLSSADGSYYTSISLGSLVIDDTTTVADFSKAILDNNTDFIEGDQISYLCYQQYLDDSSIPHVLCSSYEVVLDASDTSTLLRSCLPSLCSQTLGDGFLGTNINVKMSMFSYVHSRHSSRGIKVSTQCLMGDNSILIAQYAANFAKAAISYGITDDAFLASYNADSKEAADQPNYIEYITAGKDYYSTGTGPSFGAFRTGVVHMANPVKTTDITVGVMLSDGNIYYTDIKSSVKVSSRDLIFISKIFTELDEGYDYLLVYQVFVKFNDNEYKMLFNEDWPEYTDLITSAKINGLDFPTTDYQPNAYYARTGYFVWKVPNSYIVDAVYMQFTDGTYYTDRNAEHFQNADGVLTMVDAFSDLPESDYSKKVESFGFSLRGLSCTFTMMVP